MPGPHPTQGSRTRGIASQLPATPSGHQRDHETATGLETVAWVGGWGRCVCVVQGACPQSSGFLFLSMSVSPKEVSANDLESSRRRHISRQGWIREGSPPYSVLVRCPGQCPGGARRACALLYLTASVRKVQRSSGVHGVTSKSCVHRERRNVTLAGPL